MDTFNAIAHDIIDELNRLRDSLGERDAKSVNVADLVSYYEGRIDALRSLATRRNDCTERGAYRVIHALWAALMDERDWLLSLQHSDTTLGEYLTRLKRNPDQYQLAA